MRLDEAKDTLIEVARELLQRGLVEGTSGNLSCRIDDGRVVLTPSSLPYETMTPDDLVVTNLEGDVLEGTRAPTTEKALHLACFRKHDDIGAVIHSHALYCTMFAITAQQIPCAIEEVDIYVGGDVPVANYRLTGTDELGEEIAGWVEDRAAVLMANHGLLTVGRDPTDAMKVASLVERTAQIVWGARSLGPIVPLPEETRARFAPLYKALRKAAASKR